MNPKLVKAAALAAVAAVSVNTYYFVVQAAEMPAAERKAKEKRELELDPLFSASAKYKPLIKKRSDKIAGDPAASENATPAVAPLAFAINRDVAAVHQSWRGEVLNDHLKGDIQVIPGLDGQPERLNIKFQTAFPNRLSQEELFDGKKELWLREIGGELRRAGGAGNEVRMVGLLRGFVTFGNEERRVSADAEAKLRSTTAEELAGSIEIQKGEPEALNGSDHFVSFAEAESQELNLRLVADFKAEQSGPAETGAE